MDKQLFEVPAVAMGLLSEKLAKLNKKALKFGSGEIKLIRVGRKTDENGNQVCLVAVEGEEVRIPGYKFIGRLDHNVDPSGASNIVYTMPGEELTHDQRTAGANCEHCGWSRNRKDTYFFRADSGDMIQVGRTCLKDFMGHDPMKLVRRAQFITKIIDAVTEAGEGGKAYMTDRRWVDLETFLAYTVSCIEANGWTSGKEAWGDESKMSTRDQAANTMFHWPAPLPEDKPTEEHRATALKVMEYVATLDPAKSDFNFNMTQMVKMEVIDWKATGVAAAMTFVYTRHLEQEAAKKLAPAQKDHSTSVHVGDIKERLQLDITILSSRSHEGNFGVYNITNMVDAAGNVYVSFGKYSAAPGDKATVRGTVKRHDEFRGVKQTILNRVTVV